jgi:hypothetical protein
MQQIALQPVLLRSHPTRQFFHVDEELRAQGATEYEF